MRSMSMSVLVKTTGFQTDDLYFSRRRKTRLTEKIKWWYGIDEMMLWQVIYHLNALQLQHTRRIQTRCKEDLKNK